jgi:hypothetical protein
LILPSTLYTCSYNVLSIHRLPNDVILQPLGPIQVGHTRNNSCILQVGNFKLLHCIGRSKRYLPLPRLVFWTNFFHDVGNGSKCQRCYQRSFIPSQSLVHLPHPLLRQTTVICLHILYCTDVINRSVEQGIMSPNIPSLELFLRGKFDLWASCCPLPHSSGIVFFVGGLVNVFYFLFIHALYL